MKKTVKIFFYSTIVIIFIFTGSLFLLNTFSSKIISKLIGTNITIGDINLRSLNRGELELKNIIISPPSNPHSKVFYIGEMKIEGLNLKGKTNFTINDFCIFYNNTHGSLFLRNTIKHMQEHIKSITYCSFPNSTINTITINRIHLYSENTNTDVHDLFIPHLEFKGEEKTEPLYIFDKIDFIYNNPLKYCLFPKIYKTKINDSYFDWSLFSTEAFYCNAIQISLTNLSANTMGAQVGIFNFTTDSKQTQLGLINCSKGNSKGFQFGLFNINEKGFIPFTLIFNYN